MFYCSFRYWPDVKVVSFCNLSSKQHFPPLPLPTQLGNALRCPVGKFITHTLSHLCFLILLAAATFRLDERTYPISTARDLNNTTSQHDLPELPYEEKVEIFLKSQFRPASTLMTHVQICLMFWILGNYLRYVQYIILIIIPVQ